MYMSVHVILRVIMRYRSCYVNYVDGYIYKCMFAFVTADECKPFSFSFLRSVIVLL